MEPQIDDADPTVVNRSFDDKLCNTGSMLYTDEGFQKRSGP